LSSLPKRIVIFGINYAPELTGIAPYTTELAEHYAAQGHAVRVVTGVPHYPQWRRLAVPATNGVSNPSVVRYRHFVPSHANALGRMTYEITWFASASRSLASPGVDAVIGIVPSLSGGLLALAGGRRWGTPVGIVVKDLMGPAASQSGYRGGAAIAGITRTLEAAILRRADRIGIISDGFRPYLLAAGIPESKIERLRDWTHPGTPTESRDACRSRLGWSPSDFVCLHAGNMGQKQGLDTVLDAALLLRGGGIRFVLAGDGNDRARLAARKDRENIQNVSFLGLQAPGRYEAMLRAADVLLVNQRASVADMSLPSKLASYFAAGRPIVAAVADRSPTANEVHQAEAGVVAVPDRPKQLAKAILYLMSNHERAIELGNRGIAYAQRNLTANSALQVYDDFLKRMWCGPGRMGPRQ
jgi:putative colanic acid biosynthesis glycosyltransferase WcaI